MTADPQNLVAVEREGGIARLTMQRGDRGNALSAAMVEALDAAFIRVLDDGARMVVFVGSGRNFCTGFDLGDLESESDGDLLLRFVQIESFLQRVYHAPCLTMALAQGRIFGAGADLLVACRRRIAAPQSEIAFPGVRFGLMLGTGRLCDRIGGEAAARLLSAGAKVTAQEAARLGLVSAVESEEEWLRLLDEACASAESLSAAAASLLWEAAAPDRRAEDMDRLVRSASLPRLGERIRAYKAAMQKKRAAQ